MSKKILKRSLALGALMAFVITGSAWAESFDDDDSVIGTVENPINVTSKSYIYGGKFSTYTSNGSGAKKLNDSQNDFTGVEFKNINVKAESGVAQGGIIYNNSGYELTIKNCTFENISLERPNTGDKVSGGVITNNSGTLNMEEVTFSNNSISYTGSKTGGSAIFNSYGTGTWTRCTFSNNSISPAVWVNGGNLTLVNNKFLNNKKGGIQVVAGSVTIEGKESKFTGNSGKSSIFVSGGSVNFDENSETTMSENAPYDIQTKATGKVNILKGAVVTSNSGIYSTNTFDSDEGGININGGTLGVGATSDIAHLGGTGGTIKYLKDINLAVHKNTVTGKLDFLVEDGKVTDAVNGNIEELIGKEFAGNDSGATFKLARGSVAGEVEGTLTKDPRTGMYVVQSSDEKTHEGNAAISHNANIAMMAWRAETNDMNKRLGELRNANGEHGVWVRMVGGEDEFKSVEYEYTQYQLGYDEKLSVDPSWTVGVALSYTDGESKFTDGSGENTHRGLSVYGSKLNDDGSFIDLIAKYSRLEHDLISNGDKGDYSTNGYSVSAEYGKRFQQGKGLWIEPQVELTYGKVKSAEYKLGDKTVSQDAMESLVGRIGFSLGKDIKQGNVYARASYLYDFDGETNMAFANSGARREFKYDLGGGWWEVGVGANINLSKATYIYADVEKTFGGEVDTNWQWNLGVRYSF